MGDETIRVLVYSGGSWNYDLDGRGRYEGDGVKVDVLELPWKLTSFSVLTNLVKSAAGVTDHGVDLELTYKDGALLAFQPNPALPHLVGVGVSIQNDAHMITFMDHVRSQIGSSKPTELYLE